MPPSPRSYKHQQHHKFDAAFRASTLLSYSVMMVLPMPFSHTKAKGCRREFAMMNLKNKIKSPHAALFFATVLSVGPGRF